MRIVGAKWTRGAYAWLRSRRTARGAVLLYHRVAPGSDEPCADLFRLRLDPRLFAEHLELLRAWARPLSLGDLLGAASGGTLPPRSVALTFDDGYADFLTNAVPLLEQFEVPATVFVVAGQLGESFWWDDLTDAVCRPPTPPAELTVELGGVRHRWRLRGRGHRERRRLLRALHEFVRSLEPADAGAVVDQVASWAGVAPAGTGSPRVMTRTELAALARHELFTIGSHSVSHACLAKLSPTAQRREIQTSKSLLETASGRPVAGFSYPYGTRSDYTGDTVAAVAGAGFEYACTNVTGVVTRATEPLLIPRLWAPSGGRAELERLLGRWIG